MGIPKDEERALQLFDTAARGKLLTLTCDTAVHVFGYNQLKKPSAVFFFVCLPSLSATSPFNDGDGVPPFLRFEE